MKKIFYLTILISGLIISSCSKKKTDTGGNGTGPSKTGTTLQLIQDSIYLYEKEQYLWYNQLPSYATFNPRSFTNSAPLTALSNEMDALSQYAINPVTGKAYEYYTNSPGLAKYSFIDDGTETGALNGTKGDFGFDYNYNAVNDIRIVYVYPGSPAGTAGLTRGCQITAVNDNSDISYDGTGYGTGTGAHNNYVYNAIFNSGTVKLTVKKLDGSTVTVNLSTASYSVNPVLKETVINLPNGKKLGYLVFNSFTSDDNADPKLDAAFADFATQGITELAIDLRNNGGGYVSTAEYIDNLVVPSSKNGTNMYKAYFNDILSSGKEVLLKNQWRRDDNNQLYNLSQLDYSLNASYNTPNFAKKGSLNLSRVFFIVTGNTASASELTINNLRPVMDVQLVGETTYGKPVGFFDIDINKYLMYSPDFETKNSAGQGGYYTGMQPGSTDYPGKNALDDYTKDFGDPTEGLLSQVINKINNGVYLNSTNKVVQSFNSANPTTFSLDQSRAKTMELNKNKFTGMIVKTSKFRIKK